MLFNSLEFIIFFVVVIGLYYILPHKFGWVLLLISSCIFYMAWRMELIVLILFTTFVNYFCALKIHNSNSPGLRKNILILSMAINFGLLIFFKYLMFISHSFKWIYEYFGLIYPIGEFDIILPMGISFYTFQAASYTIDIYRKEYEPEKNFFKFALFITFFPQLVAGPIERADNLLGQLFTEKSFDTDNFSMGIKYMLMGFFKKIVIADRVAMLVNNVYNNVTDYRGIALIIATFMFTFQIYCDFSGYSDIAKGSAKCLGINLMENFDKPYLSASIKEFWRRWHISLSTWFKDYVYIPLGGSRCSLVKNYRNLFVTFMISGLWHGASWTFVIWGMLHGVYQIIGSIKNKIIPFRLPKILSVPITFCFVAFAWIFFRGNNISDCVYIVQNLFSDFDSLSFQYAYETMLGLGLGSFEIVMVTVCILWLMVTELISYKSNIHLLLNKLPFVFRLAYYYCVTVAIIALGVFGSGGEFIYFQF